MIKYSGITKDIAHYIKRAAPEGKLLFYRSAGEREFLSRWLSSPPKKPQMTGAPDVIGGIADMISECSICKNAHDKKFGYGSGENGILVILNAPSMISLSNKMAVKNESLSLLKKMLNAINVEMENEDDALELEEETRLFGRGSKLNSIDLVTLVINVEQSLAEGLGVEVSLTDEKAMSQTRSPFRDVKSLVDYICSLEVG